MAPRRLPVERLHLPGPRSVAGEADCSLLRPIAENAMLRARYLLKKTAALIVRRVSFRHTWSARAPGLALDSVAPWRRRFVYIIKSITTPDEYYVGVTSDVASRLRAHNAGLSPHTSRNRPWKTLVVIEFDDEEPALAFERLCAKPLDTTNARGHTRSVFVLVCRSRNQQRSMI